MSESPQPLNALPQGYRLQEYELVRVLGFGGFGMTYLGFDHNLDKPVAIKEYLPSDIAVRTADRSVAPQASEFRGDFQWGLERFVDEARILARFDHRHIIKVHRFFEAHGTAYIVMEYAEGETLSAYLERKGPLQEAELKAILYPLLSALEMVHGADFLHRDIKPGNIVLRDSDGSPVLLDFGAARQAIGAKSRSVTSIVTPGYAPIEQYSSRGRQGPWTDIYALGGVCYRALTGQVPEDATDRVRHDPLVPVAQQCAGRASQELLAAVDWALSVDEGARPQRVGAWREAMGTTAEKEMEDAPSVGRVERETAGQELASDAAATEKAVEEDAPSAGRVKQETPPLDRLKKTRFKWLVAVLGVVALLIRGIMYDDHAEQQRQEQAFVAEVGRKPHPRGMSKYETDLHIAAKLNLPVLTRSLLTQGADINAKNDYGGTPLHYAAAFDASATATVLLENGAQVHAKTNFGNTPLHTAAYNDASATAQVLLNNGADINAKDSNGYRPLHMAAALDASATAAVLLENGADINAKDDDGDTPLHTAAYKDASATAAVLLNNGADINAKDDDGDTPLHTAAYKDASATAAVLLNNGADINAKDNAGWTPLHTAAYKDASATATVLLENGAQVHAKTNDGGTPLHTAAYNDASATAQVLLNNGADINAKDSNGYRPLHMAAALDASATATVLLVNGAQVHAKTNFGNTPLHMAVWEDASETAALLRRYGGRE